MAEDRPNKPQDDDNEDHISKLPDCLLVEILSRLPETKHTIRTCTLSKRWKHVWTFVHSLVFVDPIFDKSIDFISLVDKTLTHRRPSKLKKFKIFMYNVYRFESQVRNWIHYAISCNVEALDLTFWCIERCEAVFVLDQLFFVNSCFTELRLPNCVFNPTGAVTWKSLKSLCISYGELDEHSIENILSGSPVLETLELESCYGYKRINIISKSVKKLVLKVARNRLRLDNDIIEINAPSILSLIVIRNTWLGKLLLLNVSSLVRAELDYSNTSWIYLRTHETTEEEMLKAFILSLLHVKNLKLGAYCYKILYRMKDKGFLTPSNLKALIKKSG